MRVVGYLAIGFAALSILLGIVGLVSWALPAMRASNADIGQAEQRVIAIVNQPVTHLPRTPVATVFSPGWFHPGAITPDFGKVDIRASQEFPYQGSTYVTSDVTPSEMFLADELEFNAMTKYFYTDRTLPKRRLSDQDMLEINQLYHAIGHDQQAVAAWRTTIASLSAIVLLLAAAALVFAQRVMLSERLSLPFQ